MLTTGAEVGLRFPVAGYVSPENQLQAALCSNLVSTPNPQALVLGKRSIVHIELVSSVWHSGICVTFLLLYDV